MKNSVVRAVRIGLRQSGSSLSIPARYVYTSNYFIFLQLIIFF